MAVPKNLKIAPFIWMAWALFLFGWILVLAAAASLQQDCSNSTQNAITAGGVAGYQGPIACGKFFGYVWWITWYLFLLIILVAGLNMTPAGFSSFRAGTLGLLVLGTMLAGDTSNTFFLWNHLDVSSTAKSRARTMLAGGIVSSMALYILIGLIGIVDEGAETVADTGEPKGQTYGGRYVPESGTEQHYTPYGGEGAVYART